MNPAGTLGVFAVGLAVIFAAAVGVGHAVGSVGVPAALSPGAEVAGHGDTHPSSDQVPAATQLPQGLAVARDGYTLRLDQPTLPRGGEVTLGFQVLGADLRPVTHYALTHDKELHLILVRRDGSSFRHVHPIRDEAGRWSVLLNLPAAGSYKVFADLRPAGRSEPVTLAADLHIAGDYSPVPLAPPTRTAEVDGYLVTLRGALVAGQHSPLVLSVSRDGVPVTDLQPYLAAYGHLVSLREGDLAYIHTHPAGAPGDGRTAPGPDISFDVEVPTEGPYRLYLDFQHHGVVRTAEFVTTAELPTDDTSSAPEH